MKASLIRLALLAIALVSFCGVGAEDNPECKVDFDSFLVQKAVCIAVLIVSIWALVKFEKYMIRKK